MTRFQIFCVLFMPTLSIGCGSRDAAEQTVPPTPKQTRAQNVLPALGPPVSATGDHGPPARGVFDVKIPTGPNWRVAHQADPQGVQGVTALTAIDPQRRFQLSVVVAPVPRKTPTLDGVKPGWESNFLQAAARKVSSEDIQISGHDAYKLTTALEGPDRTRYEAVGILLVVGGRSFTLGVTKPGTNVCQDPEAKAFIDSFKINTDILASEQATPEEVAPENVDPALRDGIPVAE